MSRLTSSWPGIGTHVLVVPGQRDVGQPLGELRQRLHVDRAGDVAAAVADVNSDPQRFVGCDHAIDSATSVGDSSVIPKAS